jgi:gliding motility-associated-like protein
MKKLYCYYFLFFFSASIPLTGFSQYILNGSATQNSCNCYSLTPAVNTQSGSVWNSNKINLNSSFDFHFNVYLGCQDANGADGIVFMLQPLSTSIGSTGEGMGFQGISPSIGITLDTWQNNNLNDPAFDHISIQSNGYINHDGTGNNLTPAVQASASNPNIEDCQWHILRITWDAAGHWLRAYFDDVLRVETQKDLVTDIFNNDPQVYWGFSGATGGANNLQQFCTALQSDFNTNFSNNATCMGTPVIFTDQSQSFTTVQNFYWDFGDAMTSSIQNPPAHNYTQPGSYPVKHVITGMDGCVSDTIVKTIKIGAKPVADFTVNDTCYGSVQAVMDQSTCSFGSVTQWTWLLDGNFLSNAQQPGLPILPAGTHTLQLVIASEYGCVSDTATKYFQVKPVPQVDFAENAGCVNKTLQFHGLQGDNLTSIIDWGWDFNDGIIIHQQNPLHTFFTTGNYLVQLTAIASNGCRSLAASHNVAIGASPVVQFSVSDTCEGNAPAITNLSTIGNGSITQWNWILDGQPSSNSQNPSLSNLSPGVHQLQLIATSNLGCASDTSTRNFIIKNRPVISANGVDGCYKQPIQFNALQLDNNTNIQQWNWNFGDSQSSSQQNPAHTFNAGGIYNVLVTAVAANGCISAAAQSPVKINQLTVNAGNDTVVVFNVPFILKGSVTSLLNSQLVYAWSPVTGLNNYNILQPSSTLPDNIIYTLTVTSPEGCVAKDDVSITVFKGSAIYVPSGFTPNNDGLNDKLKPRYIGIKQLNYFSVYNRWGQLIFSTADMNKGWDGTIKGKQQSSGSFAWIVSAVDYDGKILQLKGLSTIIR